MDSSDNKVLDRRLDKHSLPEDLQSRLSPLDRNYKVLDRIHMNDCLYEILYYVEKYDPSWPYGSSYPHLHRIDRNKNGFWSWTSFPRMKYHGAIERK
jgi:hypothetical protein